MTREEYMTELKNKINSLTDEEKAEALQYYSDYFEDADDDEKVMKELGTPDEAAKMIMEKFSNALVGTKKDEEEDSSESSPYTESDEICLSFQTSEVKNVSFDLGACHVVAIPGTKWMIETRGIRRENLSCHVTEGKLVLNNVKKMHIFDFFSHERKSRIIPRILITVPVNANVEKIKIRLGAGIFTTKELSLNAEKLDINVGAGNLILNGITGNKTNLKCGMGNCELIGNFKGKINIDCGMGAIKLETLNSIENFSFDCKVGLGDFRFGDKKYSGVQTVLPENKKENHISVNCGMGSVICRTK